MKKKRKYDGCYCNEAGVFVLRIGHHPRCNSDKLGLIAIKWPVF